MTMWVENLPILEHKAIKPDVYKMTLGVLPKMGFGCGQFVNLKVEGKTLRRPISICDYTDTTLTVVYKIIGEGTKWLAEYKEGETIEVLGSLGNGFDLNASGDEILLIGGGLGCAPLVKTAKEAVKMGKKVHVVFGFRAPEDALFEEELKDVDVDLHYAYDVEGENAVVKMMNLGFENLPYYACGPLPMMRALTASSKAHGFLSLEARMGCGFGACMGCSIKLNNRMARVCKDGPVFTSEEVVWENLK